MGLKEGAKGTVSEETRGKAENTKEEAKQAGKEGAAAAQHAAGDVKEGAGKAAEEIKVSPRAHVCPASSCFLAFIGSSRALALRIERWRCGAEGGRQEHCLRGDTRQG